MAPSGKKMSAKAKQAAAEKEKARKYEEQITEIYAYCHKHNFHSIVSEMMFETFTKGIDQPYLFMAEYLVNLNNREEKNGFRVLIKDHNNQNELAQLNRQIEIKNGEIAALKLQVRAFERRLNISPEPIVVEDYCEASTSSSSTVQTTRKSFPQKPTLSDDSDSDAQPASKKSKTCEAKIKKEPLVVDLSDANSELELSEDSDDNFFEQSSGRRATSALEPHPVSKEKTPKHPSDSTCDLDCAENPEIREPGEKIVVKRAELSSDTEPETKPAPAKKPRKEFVETPEEPQNCASGPDLQLSEYPVVSEVEEKLQANASSSFDDLERALIKPNSEKPETESSDMELEDTPVSPKNSNADVTEATRTLVAASEIEENNSEEASQAHYGLEPTLSVNENDSTIETSLPSSDNLGTLEANSPEEPQLPDLTKIPSDMVLSEDSSDIGEATDGGRTTRKPPMLFEIKEKTPEKLALEIAGEKRPEAEAQPSAVPAVFDFDQLISTTTEKKVIEPVVQETIEASPLHVSQISQDSDNEIADLVIDEHKVASTQEPVEQKDFMEALELQLKRIHSPESAGNKSVNSVVNTQVNFVITEVPAKVELAQRPTAISYSLEEDTFEEELDYEPDF